jgi:hypothetical protein
VTLLRVETYFERFPRRVSIEVHDYVARPDAGLGFVPQKTVSKLRRSTCLESVGYPQSEQPIAPEGSIAKLPDQVW